VTSTRRRAKLSDLKVGDAVRFSVFTVSGKATIGIVHAGTEDSTRPQHGPATTTCGTAAGSTGSSTSSTNQANA